ncbi:MAG: GntR family transcriptional regulator [Alicyclobacillus sp.]|nr:GntR family transcriptional regulator [Alicyclobacillus sp.]
MAEAERPSVSEDFRPIEVRVYHIIREQILSGDLRAGTRLIERELAEQLCVSRTPVREALRKLDSEGLIRIIPRRGGVVSELSAHEVLDMFRILEALEVLAVEQAAERMDDAALSVLDGVDETDAAAMLQAVLVVANNRRLEEMLHGLLDLIRATARIGRGQPGRFQEAVEEHRRILAAVKAGDADTAARAVRQHVQRSMRAYESERKRPPRSDLGSAFDHLAEEDGR